jgi:hypothetical protein
LRDGKPRGFSRGHDISKCTRCVVFEGQVAPSAYPSSEGNGLRTSESTFVSSTITLLARGTANGFSRLKYKRDAAQRGKMPPDGIRKIELRPTFRAEPSLRYFTRLFFPRAFSSIDEP